MWEELKVYKQLPKGEINPAFKKFGRVLLSNVGGYKLDQTNSIIKLSRQINHLEQSVFIEKHLHTYDLTVKTSIKPVDFYRRHKFTMLNIVSLGDIMDNHRLTSYPLTQEWSDLASYLAARINGEIEQYFMKYDSYEKIIKKRKEIEPENYALDNKYELLIYAAIRTKNKSLLISYLDKKLSRTPMQITQSEYLKPEKTEIDERELLQQIKKLAVHNDFESIEDRIAAVSNTN